MASQESEQTGCRVEISGWDLGENFFVEKAILCRCDDGSRSVLLHTPLRVGGLVFVRPSDHSSAARAVPVTYQVATMNGNASGGGREIRLTERHPQHRSPRQFTRFLSQDVAKN
ncbi:MAG TPA: hypothetical protein VNF02_07115 [Candidatus Limnocylindrales bacterium]|nr:hypothetical protein [Candidatus Limnocylindrales bacterium]